MFIQKRKRVVCIGMMLVLTAFVGMTTNVSATGLPPVAEAGGPYAGYECNLISLNASGSYDPEGAPLTYRWNINGLWIDNMMNPLLEWMWLDDFLGNITLEVSDGDLTATDTAKVIALNVPPVIASVDGPSVVELGTEVFLSVNFYDGLPDPRGLVASLDTYTATFSWGDGNSTVLSLGVEEFWANAFHEYSEIGVYHVIITIVDDNGGEASTEWYIVVYSPNPNCGFVTGGGWIIALPGSYPADPTLTGRCNFGFVSKYKKGQNTPDGNTEFQFQAAGLNFHSHTYEWLVVAGSKAMYKGVGTINGVGNYGFKLTAIDGQINGGGGFDKFRMKIWDQDNPNVIVFDNNIGESDGQNPSTILGGGQITIHKE